jgi:hypothetical protein
LLLPFLALRRLGGSRERDERARYATPRLCIIMEPDGRKKKKGGKSMAHWLLTPIDHRAKVWKTYAVQRLVVAAPDERTALEQVAQAAPETSEPNPWLDPALTSCEEVDGPV